MRSARRHHGCTMEQLLFDNDELFMPCMPCAPFEYEALWEAEATALTPSAPNAPTTRTVGTMTHFFGAYKLPTKKIVKTAPRKRGTCCLCVTQCTVGYCICIKARTPCVKLCGKGLHATCGNRTGEYDTAPPDRCSCQKSQCRQKYCVCHADGRMCGALCKCLQCKNAPES